MTSNAGATSNVSASSNAHLSTNRIFPEQRDALEKLEKLVIDGIAKVREAADGTMNSSATTSVELANVNTINDTKEKILSSLSGLQTTLLKEIESLSAVMNAKKLPSLTDNPYPQARTDENSEQSATSSQDNTLGGEPNGNSLSYADVYGTNANGTSGGSGDPTVQAEEDNYWGDQ